MTTDTPTGITSEDRDKLRAPFAASAIRWLPIGGLVANNSKQQFMPHINASLVFERLSEVDPSWTLDDVKPEAGSPDDPLGMSRGAPHRAWITVKGVQRSGRGTSVPTEPAKSAESDAIKRAALAFEIGAYLRAFETVLLPSNNGALFSVRQHQGKTKMGYLTAAGKKALADHYTRVVTHAMFRDRYGAPVEYGDVASVEVDDSLADDEGAAEVEQTQPAAGNSTDDQVEVLVMLSEHNGRDTGRDTVEATMQSTPFVRGLAKMLGSVAAHLLLDPEDIEKLRDASMRAAGGDDAAVTELAQALEELAAYAEAKRSEAAAAKADA